MKFSTSIASSILIIALADFGTAAPVASTIAQSVDSVIHCIQTKDIGTCIGLEDKQITNAQQLSILKAFETIQSRSNREKRAFRASGRGGKATARLAKPAHAKPKFNGKASKHAKSLGKTIGATAFSTALGTTFSCLANGGKLSCLTGKSRRDLTVDETDIYTALANTIMADAEIENLPLSPRDITSEDFLDVDEEESTLETRDSQDSDEDDYEDEDEDRLGEREPTIKARNVETPHATTTLSSVGFAPTHSTKSATTGADAQKVKTLEEQRRVAAAKKVEEEKAKQVAAARRAKALKAKKVEALKAKQAKAKDDKEAAAKKSSTAKLTAQQLAEKKAHDARLISEHKAIRAVFECFQGKTDLDINTCLKGLHLTA